MTDDRSRRGSEELDTDPYSDDDPTTESAAHTRTRRSARGTRVEMMRAARRERRRRAMGRFWLASVPVLVLLGVAVVLLSVYGGQGDGGSVVETTTVTTPAAVDGSALLLVESDDALSSVVILQPWNGGGVVLATPGITLLETQGAFTTLVESYEDGGADAVRLALSQALEIPLGPTAVVDEEDLQTAISASGLETIPEEGSVTLEEQATSVALAVRGLVSDHWAEEDSTAWVEMELQGDGTTEFLRAIGSDAVSMTEDVWMTGVLAGTLVESDDFSYWEPDIEAARSLLVVTVAETIVTVEVRDGAGVEGAARLVGDLLETAGFALAPMSYAEGYPGVERTQILASVETLKDAGQVVSVIGVGDIVADTSLESDHIVIVLGSDFSDGSASSTDGVE